MPFVRLQFRRGLSTDWTIGNPLLGAGEMAIESDTNLFKIGDGITRWVGLGYAGLHGPTGTTGTTGPTGYGGAGETGPTGAAGNTFLTSTTTVITPNPVEGGSISLTVASNLAYITGNSVIVIDSTNSANFFAGRVQSYSAGALVLDSIKNIEGTFGSAVYNVNLNGSDGASGTTGSTGPTGPSGSVTVYSITFDGGSSTSSYISGPAFDCGSSI